MSELWHCYPERGEMYEDLVKKYGAERMAYAVLHLSEPTREEIRDMAHKVAPYWWEFW